MNKVRQFLEKTAAHSKYGIYRKKFRRLKVISYDINEIWSIDLAYVDKLAKYNNGVKYLLVAVDVLSRFLRVEPMKSKDAPEAMKAFKRMIKHKNPKNYGLIKEPSSREHLKRFAKNKI